MKFHQWVKFFLWIAFFITGWILFVEAMYIDKNIVCAKFYGQSKVKGTMYMDYHYKFKNKRYSHSVARSTMNIKYLEELREIDCIEIEYSNWIPSFSRVIDKRVVK
jgi:hypothetical protein